MKRTKKILSAALSAVLALSTVGVNPVLAAPGKESNLFALELDGKYLTENSPHRLYLDSLDGKEPAIYSVEYNYPRDKVSVDEKNGIISIAPEAEITDGEPITLSATVKYYDPEDVIFYDSFEGEKKFTEGDNPESYKHSEVKSHWGRTAGTPVSGVKGPVKHVISGEKDTIGTVTAWFYDTADMSSSTTQAKLAFEVNQAGISGNHAMGVIFDKALIENNIGSKEKYVFRNGETVQNYGWLISNVERTEGWHELCWDVSESGTTAYIDGQEIYKNTGLTSIGWVSMMTNWNGNDGHNIDEKMFFDDVTVVKPEARVLEETICKEITLRKHQDYTLDGETEVRFDITQAQKPEISVRMLPNVDLEMEITLNGEALTKGTDYTVDGDKIIFDEAYISDLAFGKHEFLLHVLDKTLTFKVIVFSSIGSEYYFSNVYGDDTNDGLSETTPWKTLDKLNSMVLQPGDTVYLDAKSTWEGQIIIDESGLDGMPITITKYNAESREERPVINAGSHFKTQADIRKPKILTLANQGSSCYAAGAIEVLNASYINISGLEITNNGGEADSARLIGRNGILVIADLPDTTTADSYMSEWDDAYQTDLYISDCYVHDVNSSAAYKMAGGINILGNVDNILVENCTAENCDNEGIRNAGLYNRNTQWPAVHKVTYRNNYIAGSTGDGMVISNVKDSVISGNVVTQCGEPKLSGTANYAALWVCGSDGAVLQHNEVFNNPYDCADDGEAFDFDHGTKDSVYQYNYTHDNRGGAILFMNSMAGRNAFRYNISVDDGGDPHNPHVLFYNPTTGKAPYIYNNVFVLAQKVSWLYGNDSGTEVRFYNNIVMSVNGNLPEFSKKKFLTGEIKNNLFYPETLLDGMQNAGFDPAVIIEGNITGNPKLVSAGSKPEGIITNPGTAEAKFDTEKLEAYKLLADSPAINAGIPVELSNDAGFSKISVIDTDLFGNAINDNPDIGVHEWNNDSPNVELPESVEVTADQTEIIVDESIQLHAQVLPSAVDQTVRWESSNEEVAAVDVNTGIVTGKGVGTAVITAISAADASVRGNIEITVSKFGPGVLYGFKVCADEQSVAAGESVQLSVEGVDRYGDKVEVSPENIVEVVYTADAGTVDENGVLTVPKDVDKQAVSVSAQVKVKFNDYVETFETGSSLSGGSFSLERTENFGHDDDYSMKTLNYSGADDDAYRAFADSRQGTVSIWFYDYDPSVEKVRKSISVSSSSSVLNALGIHWDGSSGSPKNYVYRTGDTVWRDSRIQREEGWHEFKWNFSDEGLELYIDDTLVGENPSVKSYKRISILSRKGWASQGNTGFYVDDIQAYTDEQYHTESIRLNIIQADTEFYTKSIKVVENPDKMIYNIGDTFDPAGMKVVAIQKASSSNATSSNATPSNAISGNANLRDNEREVELDLNDLEFENDVFEQSGKATVTVVYNEVNENQEERRFTASVKVTVNEESLPDDQYYTISIKKNKNPDKMIYKVGDTFDPEGLVVIAHRKATPSNAVRDEVISLDELDFMPGSFTKAGNQKVTVIYYGLDKNLEEKRFTLTLTVKVEENGLPTTPEKPDDNDDSDGGTHGGTHVTVKKAVRTVKGNWKRDEKGWWFTYTDGGYAANKWELVNGHWYYFNELGYMATGWNYINGIWYYLDPVTGAMRTGWYQDLQDSCWYYFDPITGAMQTGWIQLNGKNYYLNAAASVSTWIFNIETGRWEYVNRNAKPYGAMYRNEMAPNGEMVDDSGAKIK